MRFRYDEFPDQPEPVYDFYIAEDKELRVRKHYRYETDSNGRHKTYRIHTGAGIVAKRDDQMDRVLAGHVFTLDYDPGRILDLMMERAEADAVRASVLAENARCFKNSVARARRHAVVEEAYGTVMQEKPKRAWTPVPGDRNKEEM